MAETVVEHAERVTLLREIKNLEEVERAWLRKAILEHRRLDLLAQVMGLKPKPFQKKIQRFQLANAHSLVQAFRGSGKTTTATIVHAVWHILKNPNIRILIASKTSTFAQDILKEIKAHLESDRITELFGQQRGSNWSGTEIDVLGKTSASKESTVTTVGVEGQVVGKHYDVIFGDDLVDEDNSRTPYMRERVKTFFYKTLMPTLEPFINGTDQPGELHVLGTRYHFEDLYGHLIKNEMAKCHLVIPALDEADRTPWPEKFSVEFFRDLRRRMGTIIFNSQYQCDTEAMKGEIFQIDWMPEIEYKDLPRNMRIYIGVDLAVAEKELSDFFAMVAIGVCGEDVYVLDCFERRIPFPQQVEKILEWNRKFEPVRIGIECNAYQAALATHLKTINTSLRIKRIYTEKDKVTRAWKLSAIMEDGRVKFLKGRCGHLIDHLVLFPGHRYKDLFDALDNAILTATSRGKFEMKKRRSEFGVL